MEITLTQEFRVQLVTTLSMVTLTIDTGNSPWTADMVWLHVDLALWDISVLLHLRLLSNVLQALTKPKQHKQIVIPVRLGLTLSSELLNV